MVMELRVRSSVSVSAVWRSSSTWVWGEKDGLSRVERLSLGDESSGWRGAAVGGGFSMEGCVD